MAETRTGKALADTSGTDLYLSNSAPSKRSLGIARSGLPVMRDQHGRAWHVYNASSAFRWPRAKQIRESIDFDEDSDRIFFVRPAARDSARLVCVGEEIHLSVAKGKKILQYITGTVKRTTYDEPGATASVRPGARMRKTIVVVLAGIKEKPRVTDPSIQ